MSLAAQVRLLRVLQEKEFIPVGSTTPKTTDVRLIAATNRNLSEEVKEGRFREDLYYRLNVIEISIPPLRDRRDDIPLLAKHFLQSFNKDKNDLVMSDDAMSKLIRHGWPGNVRELENAIERSLALTSGETIEVADLPAVLQQDATPVMGLEHSYAHLSLQEARETFEQGYIKEVLTKTGGNITRN